MGKYKTIQELKKHNGWAKLNVNVLWDKSGKYIFEGEEEKTLFESTMTIIPKRIEED